MKRCLIIGALLVSAVTSFASPIGDTFDQTRKNGGEPTYARDGYFIWYHADTGGCTWVKYSSEDFTATRFTSLCSAQLQPARSSDYCGGTLVLVTIGTIGC